MKNSTQIISIKLLKENKGQINGLPKNPRFIRDDKFEQLKTSLRDDPEMLELRELIVFPLNGNYIIICGNMRYLASLDIGLNELPCKILKPDISIEKLRAITIKDNVSYGAWDMDLLSDAWNIGELGDFGLSDILEANNVSIFDQEDSNSENSSLAERFGIPPFSILDTRQGYWQKRKKAWREAIGDTLGESREDTLIQSLEMKYPDLYQKSQKHRAQLKISFREYFENYVSKKEKESASKIASAGVSLFDPVVSEICCRWFTPNKGAKIFDCFAGDTQKGLVFGMLGYEFIGIELRQEQIDINNKVIADSPHRIKYICDDGQNVLKHIDIDSQDLLFSCPPYYNLEVYSDFENDASNQGTYEEFLTIITNAYQQAINCLKNNRFAVIVVGDVRDKKTGFYHNFVDDIKRIFINNGCRLYNELIIVEQAVSTALRASACMKSRKVAKLHQNVLVFYKGNTKEITKLFPEIDITKDDLTLFDEANEVGE